MGAPFTRLLLATEHSEFDSGAEALALALAQRCALPLAGVLPVLGSPEFEMVAPQLAAKADHEASLKREHLLALAQAAGVLLELRVRHGPEPFEEIVQEAQVRAADLIIIRRRGQRGLLARLLVGEMVSKVVAHAPCSVLVAPRGARMWQRRVLVGVDPLAVDAAMLALAARLAADCGLPLGVLCVASDAAAGPRAAAALASALAQARATCSSADGELRVGPAHQQLLAAAADGGADLIVIGRHSRHGRRARIGREAQKVIGLAECPVLVYAHPHVHPHVHNPKAATP